MNKTRKTELLQRHLKSIKDKDFEKPRKNDRKKINDAVDILHNDGMWTTTERVDLEVGKTQKE